MKSIILLIIAISCIQSQKESFLRHKNFTNTSFPYQDYFNNTEENIILSDGDEINSFDIFKTKGSTLPSKILKYILKNDVFTLSNNEVENKLNINYLGKIVTNKDYDSYLFSVQVLNKNILCTKSLIRLNVKDENLCSMVYLYHISLSSEFQYQEHTKIISSDKFQFVSTVLSEDFVENDNISNENLFNDYRITNAGFIEQI